MSVVDVLMSQTEQYKAVVLKLRVIILIEGL